MAINASLLIISPVTRQYFIDPISLLPVVGYVNYFKLNKITPKNTYQQDGVGGFQIAANPIVLDTAGAIPFVSYLYPYDENDASVEGLYYIEVRRTADDSLVFALDNFPQNFISDGGDAGESDVTNKCPSYGFDNPVFGNTYTVDNENPIPTDFSIDLQNGARVAQGWLWQLENVEDSQFFYELTPIATGSRPGNPLFLLTLSSGVTIQAQTQHVLGFRLGIANELNGTIINYQLDMQDNLSGLSELTVSVFNGATLQDVSNKTDVGTIPIDGSLTNQTISFTMPDLSGDIESDNAPTWLLLNLPTAAQFSLSFTSTYDYFGEAQTISRLPIAQGSSQAKQLFSLNSKEYYDSDENYLQSDLPMTQRKGSLQSLKRTGEIFLASTDYSPELDGAHLLDDTTLVRGENLLGTLTDRFLDFSGLSKYGGNTFIITNNVANVFDIKTQDTSNSATDWVASTNISIVQNAIAGGMPITAADEGSPGKLDITFDSSFNALTTQNFNVSSGSAYDLQYFIRKSGFFASVLNNNVGNYSEAGFDGAVLKLDFNVGPVIDVVTVNNGNGGPATCTLEFSSGGFSSEADIKSSIDLFQDVIPDPIARIGLYVNYLAFNDIFNATISDPPPYAIQFNIDGVGESVKSKNKTLIVDLDSSQLTDRIYLATTLKNDINGSFSYTITVDNKPDNGESIQISTSNKTINLVMWETDLNPTRPSKPDLNISTVYVRFLSIDNTTQVASSIITAIFT